MLYSVHTHMLYSVHTHMLYSVHTQMLYSLHTQMLYSVHTPGGSLEEEFCVSLGLRSPTERLDFVTPEPNIQVV